MKAALPAKDLLAASLVLCSAIFELAIRELYYRLAAELPQLVFAVALWLTLSLALFGAARRLSPAVTIAAGRITFFLGVAVWLNIVGGSAVTSAMGSGPVSTTLLFTAYATTLLGACFAPRIPNWQWGMLRRLVSVICVLFVVSQPVIAALRAPDIRWPDRAPPTGASVSKVVSGTTIFLLLDELNAKSAAPIVGSLARAGAGVRFKSLVPVGDATSKVIPALFTGHRFDEAKPCGLDTVCSGGRVLDFSKIVASRTDVDVVGFYEPYCAIRGLRYCARVAPDSPALDPGRWWCAALRRSQTLASLAGPEVETHCAAMNGEVWGGLVARAEAALWRAPVWQRGGFLYAHVPLPHPPGARGGDSLPEHYEANLRRATQLVDGIVHRLQQNANRPFSVVVFSDHPLRGSLWCASAQYTRNGCPLDVRLVDDMVPLIVMGDVPTAFELVRGNIDIFELASSPKQTPPASSPMGARP